MKKQLHLPIIELLEKGFTGRNIAAEGMNREKRIYELPISNGRIYYNPEEREYVWYLQINVGEGANHTNLNIETLGELQVFLKIVS